MCLTCLRTGGELSLQGKPDCECVQRLGQNRVLPHRLVFMVGLFGVLIDSLLYGEVTNNVVPDDLGRRSPEADIGMLRKGGCSSCG